MALTDKLTAIGNAIRSKTGDTGLLSLDAMPEAIGGITTGFPNGTKWTEVTTSNGAMLSCKDAFVVYANGIWIMYSTYAGSSYYVYYSLNGKEWNTTSLRTKCNKIVYANGIWVAGTSSIGLYYSLDGKEWTQSNITSGSYGSISNANGIWVCHNYYSLDGKEWIKSNIASAYNPTFANGIWITGSSSGLYYSLDGKEWTQSNITSDSCNYLANSNGIWVAGTSSIGLYYSLDGKEWTQSNITSGNVQCISNANGIWVAGISPNGLYYSLDGKEWTQSNITYGNVQCISNANGIWIANIYSHSINCYSFDGIKWVEIANFAANNFVNANGIWVAGCANDAYYSTTWEPST